MNPLFNNMGKINQLQQAMKMIRGGNPQQIAMNMLQNNPAFKQFYEANKTKTPEQIAQENGMDLGQIMAMFR